MIDLLERLGTSLYAIFAGVFDPSTGLHWLFLSSALLLALGVYWFRDSDQQRNLVGFLGYCFPRRIYTHRSAKLDFRFFVVNSAFSGLFLVPFVLSAAAVSHFTWMGLRSVFGQPEPLFMPGLGANALLTVAVILAIDLGHYVAHWHAHHVRFLWEFHKVHHSAEVLHPVTAFRDHPVVMFVSTTFRGFASGIAFGCFYFLYAGEVDEVRFLGLNLFAFLFSTAGFNLRHTHIWVSYRRALNRIFISPAHHQIHHSAAPRHVNKNLGLIFSFWDQLFGTHYVPGQREALDYGLCNRQEGAEFRSVVGLYLVPFRNVARLVGQSVLVRRLTAYTASSAPTSTQTREGNVSGCNRSRPRR